MTILSDYITQTRRLLHDVSSNFYSDSELTDYINEARSCTVSNTSCLRQLQAPIFQPSSESYAFGGLSGINVSNGGSGYNTAPTIAFTGGGGTGAVATATVVAGVVTNISINTQGSGYTSSPTIIITPTSGGAGATANAGFVHALTLDILSIVIIWGNFRIGLAYMPFTELTAKLRMWTTWQQRPAAFSIFGQSSVFIAPMPDQLYVGEVDSVILPNPLIDNTTVEQIAYPFTTPVPYYAARLAKIKEQSMSESELFLQMYKRRALDAIGSTFTRRLP